MGNTKTIGNKGEAATLAALVKLEFPVLTPFGDNERYDLVVEVDGTFHRIQCRTGQLKKSCIEWRSGRVVMGRRIPYQLGSVDWFAVYCEKIDQVYILHESMRSKLRIDPPKNNQKKGVVWARDHLIENWTGFFPL